MEIYGSFRDYFAAFGLGVLTSFTPCVYPLLPITASFIAGMDSRGTKLMAFLLSLLYVFGMAITYSAIAVIAAFSGIIFGLVQSHPITHILVAHVLIFFALVLFDIIPLPVFGFTIHNKIKMRNAWAVLLFGMASGLAMGPCTAPAVGALITYITLKQNILHGVALMFVFSYGLGASLILVGTFGGFLGNLPKSGEWLVRVKHICGWMLVLAAEFFILKAGGIVP
ncbi:MAG: sulfite exporter TauE/SafE family protein [Candidatus Omnitrophica bacterium]|nr:sulfite exporter TauE/SafE family protein [Candidatus Omnitrophota bacterium]